MRNEFRHIFTAFCVVAAIGSLAVIGCSAPSSTVGQPSEPLTGRNKTGDRYEGEQTSRLAQAGLESRGSSTALVEKHNTAGLASDDGSETELWLFGPVNKPELTTPLGARGIRTIIDMRNLPVNQAKNFLKTYADRGLGLALCFRWRNPSSGTVKVKITKNYDVPPTKEEADSTISKLKEIFKSEEAKRIGNRLFVQFYNEVGGGPGTFLPDQADELLAFATKAAAEIRTVNSELRICGPAITGGQLLSKQSTRTPKMAGKAAVIKKAISWSAEHADVIDLHMHAVDGEWARDAAEKLRNSLDMIPRGKTVGMVSFEWSCARYPDRENDEGVRNAIRGIWEAMSDFNFVCAAYGPYWPLKNKASEKINDLFGWVSIVDAKGRRNPPIYETLQEIGGGDGAAVPKRGGRSGRRSKNNGK